MEELKVVFASNLIQLRTRLGMTQAELAGKINYSDKSISKWERAEALPDVGVVKAIADILGVSVDYMLQTHDQWTPDAGNTTQRRFNEKMVVCVSMLGTWTLALLVFVICWILGFTPWIIFIAAVPLSLVALLVLNIMWNENRGSAVIVSFIVLGVFAVIYYVLRAYNPWQLFFVLVPAQCIVFFSYKIRRVPQKTDTKA